MKNKIRYFLTVICALLTFNCFATPRVVDYIYDGDTFAARVMLRDDIEITVRVRMINIDTAEMNGACDAETRLANRAHDRLMELIPIGSVVELSEIKDDKYLGRIDARVMFGGRDIGKILINEKLARSYSGGKRKSWCEI
jgi:endonuclease YncB( thermonuclease family)